MPRKKVLPKGEVIDVIGTDVAPALASPKPQAPSPSRDYSPKPISVVRAGGPIERLDTMEQWRSWYNAASATDQKLFDYFRSHYDNPASRIEALNLIPLEGSRADAERAYAAWKLAPEQIVLHPGHYVYSDVTKNGPAFKRWLTETARTVKVLETQEAVAVVLGGPYYIDYVFEVSRDVIWPAIVDGEALHGIPTWIPRSTKVSDYLKSPEAHVEFSDQMKKLAEETASVVKTTVALALVIVVAFLLSQASQAKKTFTASSS